MISGMDETKDWKPGHGDKGFLSAMKVAPFEISELDALLAETEDARVVRAKANARLKRERILWFAACWLLAVAVVILACTGHWS